MLEEDRAAAIMGCGIVLAIIQSVTKRLKPIFAWFAAAVLVALAAFLAAAGSAAADASSEMAIDAAADHRAGSGESR